MTSKYGSKNRCRVVVGAVRDACHVASAWRCGQKLSTFHSFDMPIPFHAGPVVSRVRVSVRAVFRCPRRRPPQSRVGVMCLRRARFACPRAHPRPCLGLPCAVVRVSVAVVGRALRTSGRAVARRVREDPVAKKKNHLCIFGAPHSPRGMRHALSSPVHGHESSDSSL